MDSLIVWGYILVTLYLIGMIIIGYVSRKKASVGLEAHYLGGRSMHPAVIAVTFITASTSAGVFMGEPGLAYNFGIPALWAPLALITGLIVTTLLYTSRLRKFTIQMGSLTMPDYLGKRYDSDAVRIILALLIIIFYSVAMIAQFKGAAILFNTVLGIPFNISLIVFGVIVAVYVSMGGFRAIAWTDTIQGLPMVFFSVVLIITSLVLTGGMSGLSSRLSEIGPELANLFEPSTYSPSGIVGLYVFWTLIFISNPHLSTKFMAMRSTGKSDMRIFLYITLALGLIINLNYIIGLAGRVMLPDLDNVDYATIMMAIEFLPPIIAAIMMVGILSAVMSTIDSLLLVVGTAISEDIYRKTFKPDASEKSMLRLTQFVIIAVALVVMLLTLWNTPEFLAIVFYVGTSGVGIAVAPALLIGLFWEKATKWGALLSMLIGVSCYSGLVLWSNLGTFVEILIGAVVAFATMILGSLFTAPPKEVVLNQFKGTA